MAVVLLVSLYATLHQDAKGTLRLKKNEPRPLLGKPGPCRGFEPDVALCPVVPWITHQCGLAEKESKLLLAGN